MLRFAAEVDEIQQARIRSGLPPLNSLRELSYFSDTTTNSSIRWWFNRDGFLVPVPSLHLPSWSTSIFSSTPSVFGFDFHQVMPLHSTQHPSDRISCFHSFDRATFVFSDDVFDIPVELDERRLSIPPTASFVLHTIFEVRAMIAQLVQECGTLNQFPLMSTQTYRFDAIAVRFVLDYILPTMDAVNCFYSKFAVLLEKMPLSIGISSRFSDASKVTFRWFLHVPQFVCSTNDLFALQSLVGYELQLNEDVRTSTGNVCVPHRKWLSPENVLNQVFSAPSSNGNNNNPNPKTLNPSPSYDHQFGVLSSGGDLVDLSFTRLPAAVVPFLSHFTRKICSRHQGVSMSTIEDAFFGNSSTFTRRHHTDSIQRHVASTGGGGAGSSDIQTSPTSSSQLLLLPSAMPPPPRPSSSSGKRKRSAISIVDPSFPNPLRKYFSELCETACGANINRMFPSSCMHCGSKGFILSDAPSPPPQTTTASSDVISFTSTPTSVFSSLTPTPFECCSISSSFASSVDSSSSSMSSSSSCHGHSKLATATGMFSHGFMLSVVGCLRPIGNALSYYQDVSFIETSIPDYGIHPTTATASLFLSVNHANLSTRVVSNSMTLEFTDPQVRFSQMQTQTNVYHAYRFTDNLAFFFERFNAVSFREVDPVAIQESQLQQPQPQRSSSITSVDVNEEDAYGADTILSSSSGSSSFIEDDVHSHFSAGTTTTRDSGLHGLEWKLATAATSRSATSLVKLGTISVKRKSVNPMSVTVMSVTTEEIRYKVYEFDASSPVFQWTTNLLRHGLDASEWTEHRGSTASKQHAIVNPRKQILDDILRSATFNNGRLLFNPSNLDDWFVLCDMVQDNYARSPINPSNISSDRFASISLKLRPSLNHVSSSFQVQGSAKFVPHPLFRIIQSQCTRMAVGLSEERRLQPTYAPVSNHQCRATMHFFTQSQAEFTIGKFPERRSTTVSSDQYQNSIQSFLRETFIELRPVIRPPTVRYRSSSFSSSSQQTSTTTTQVLPPPQQQQPAIVDCGSGSNLFFNLGGF